jgi:Spermine/spermidine synthase domain
MTDLDAEWADATDDSPDGPDLMRDLDRPNAYQLYIGGTPQSHVDLDDPTYLEFEYVRRLGHVIDLCAPPGTPLRALHLGGGGLTLARYIAVTRPGSGQQAVEIDGDLLDFVRKELPLPRNARVRLRTGDGRDVLSRVPESAFDLAVTDVFEASRIPAAFNSVEYAELAARALRPGGIHAVNLADGGPAAGLRFTQSQVANAREYFANIVLIADPGVLRGRRFGNVILLASDAELPVEGLTRRTASDPFPGRVVAGDDLKAFAGSAKPVHDADAIRSPERPGDIFKGRKR